MIGLRYLKSNYILRRKVVRGTDMGQRPPSPLGRGGALDSIRLGQQKTRRQNLKYKKRMDPQPEKDGKDKQIKDRKDVKTASLVSKRLKFKKTWTEKPTKETKLFEDV